MKKNILSVLALILTVLLICSCSAIQVKDVSAIATVNGEEILTEEYNYFLLMAKQTILGQAGASADSEEFWKTTDIDGQNAGELAKQNALDNAVRYSLIAQKAKELGITADSAEAKEQINAALSANASAFESQFGISKDTLKAVLEKVYLENLLVQKFQEDGEIDLSEENVKKVYEEKYRTIKHILYALDDPETGETRYEPAQVYEFARNTIDMIKRGEFEFDEIMRTNSMDPGIVQNPDGYTFTNNGTMVAPFEAAAFNLEVGEMSEPVVTSYGCHILKREPLLAYDKYIETNGSSEVNNLIAEEYLESFVEKLKADAKIEKNEKVYNKISL